MAAQQSTPTGLHLFPLFSKTEGLADKIDPMRVEETGLVTAENVVIDISGGIKRRQGATLLHSGNCHSLFSAGDFGYCVINGVLTLIEEDYSLWNIGTVGDVRLNYVYTFDGLYDVVYFVGETINGKIVNRNSLLPWTTSDYVGIASTEAQSKEYLSSPPLGELIEVYNGRMFIVDDNVLYYSSVFDFSRFEMTAQIVFEDSITMLVSLSTGLYVGTTNNVYFLHGEDPLSMVLIPVYHAGAISGTAVRVSAYEIIDNAISDVIVFSVSGESICIGNEQGRVLSLTNTFVEFPGSSSGACFVTHDKQYIVSLGE